MLARLFTEHPASVDESYLGHMGKAFGFGGRMIAAGAACLLHGLFPFLFTTAGSDAMERLHAEMSERRRKAAGGGGRQNPAPSPGPVPAMRRHPVIRRT